MIKHLLQLLFCIGILSHSAIAQHEEIGGGFELITHLNENYSLASSKGKVVLLFFGFTHCPDVCPNTFSSVQTVLNQLGDQAEHVQPLFVSVDPMRDSPGALKNYLKYFGNNFIGLTGTIEQIDKVVKQYRGFYSYEKNITAGTYTIDHTSNLYIINRTGEVANIMPYGLPPQAITEMIRKLLPKSEF